MRLKTMATGCAKMAAKLALVIAQRAFPWLYDFGIQVKIVSKRTEKSGVGCRVWGVGVEMIAG